MGRRRTIKHAAKSVEQANGTKLRKPIPAPDAEVEAVSNLIAHARRELNRVSQRPDGSFDKDQVSVNEHILKMISIFAREGHSGFSAGWAAAALNRLLKFKPLTPLLGTPDEWVHVGDNEAGVPIYQNSRYGCVFKEGDGQAYDIETRVYDDGRSLFQRGGDRQPISFPYAPPAQPEVIQVDEQGNRTFKVDFIYDADGWEMTYPWSERQELVEDRPEPFEPYMVHSLLKGPDLWVISIPVSFNVEDDDFEDFEDKFFLSEEEAKRGLEEAKERLRAEASKASPETGDRPSETAPEVVLRADGQLKLSEGEDPT